MSELFDNGDVVPQADLILLGYKCYPEDRSEVIQYLAGLSDQDHSVFCTWVMYGGIDNLLVTAEDVVIDQDARKKEGQGELTLPNALEQLDERMAYLRFIDNSDRVATLEYIEPEDGIGEGDVSNLEWRMMDGGQQDIAVHKVIEFSLKVLDNWQQWMKGESRIRWHGAGGRGGAIEHIYRIAEKYSPENMQRETERFATSLVKLMELLQPAFQATHQLLEDLGYDADELMGIKE